MTRQHQRTDDLGPVWLAACNNAVLALPASARTDAQHALLPSPQVQGMQLEARSLPGPQAQPLLAQVAKCTADLAGLRQELQGGGAAADRVALVRPCGWACVSA